MPHATIDYSHNIAAMVKDAGVVSIVHKALRDSGLFNPADLKTRCYEAHHYRVGDNGDSFLHVMIGIKAGRDEEMKTRLVQNVVAALRAALPGVSSVTADLYELSAYYTKSVLS